MSTAGRRDTTQPAVQWVTLPGPSAGFLWAARAPRLAVVAAHLRRRVSERVEAIFCSKRRPPPRRSGAASQVSRHRAAAAPRSWKRRLPPPLAADPANLPQWSTAQAGRRHGGRWARHWLLMMRVGRWMRMRVR